MRKTHGRTSALWVIFSIVLAGLGSACVRGSAVSQPQSQTQETFTPEKEFPLVFNSIKCLTPAPQWYKNLWLDLNAPENELGRALMTHYMGCSGKPFKMTAAQFRALPVALVDDELNPFLQFAKHGELLRREGELSEDYDVTDFEDSILVSTHYGNTLGHFQLHVKGDLKFRKNEMGVFVPRFEGVAKVEDRYDFDPSLSAQKDSWRGNDTEFRVRIAHFALPGRAFDVTSEEFSFQMEIPTRAGELAQRSENDEKSGYSSYGEQVQAVLMTEMRSTRWENSSLLQRISILAKLMKRLHEALLMR
ncbi:MAG: hypothetical protein RIR26_1675 [Pseudomonadota bacterium]